VGIPENEEADNAAKERTTTKKIGTYRLQNEKSETTKNKKKRQERDDTKRSGSGQPITDRVF
jgi:hypothetical protein